MLKLTNRWWVGGIVFLVLCLGCEQIFFAPKPPNTPPENFDSLWRTFETRYSFFSYKNIDWDSVYQVYRPQVTAQTSDEELFEIFFDMLLGLRDGHVYMVSEFDAVRFLDYYLTDTLNFNFGFVEKQYLGARYQLTGPVFHTWLPDSIAYLYYGSFNGNLSPDRLDYLFNRYQSARGLIFDIRNNEGGDPANAYRFIRRIADQERLVLRSRYKIGPEPGAFSEWEEISLGPEADEERTLFDKPIVVLINRRNFSAASVFTAAISPFPQVTIIGDTTGGGGGVPAGAELPNGWYYGFSSSQLAYPDGRQIEGGALPDIVQFTGPEDELRGVDAVIERAREVLR